jgi:hypothetical protein
MAETSTLPHAEIVHQLPGRLRLRVPAARGNPQFFGDLAQRLGTLAGVRQVRANPRTGSLLVAHAGEAEAFRRAAREAELLEVSPLAAPGPVRARAYSERLAHFPPLSLAAAGLTGLGVAQVARGKLFGTASENFWMAFRIYAVMNRPRIAALLILLGLYRLAQGELLGSAESLFWYAAQANRMAKRQGGAG